MKIGLFFGSFNPIHIGHLALANYFVEYTDVDKIWFLVSPHNPFKSKSELADEHVRSYLIRTAINNDKRFEVNDLQFDLPQPSYSIDALNKIQEGNIDNNEFVIIAGTDVTNEIRLWKDWEKIIDNWQFYIYPRLGYNRNEFHRNIKYFNDAPQFDISASMIRKAIADNKDIRYFLPQNTFDLINLYKIYK